MKKDTRDAILEHAKKIFSEKGYHDTSVSDIISAAGMAQGSFYNYFKSKKAIFHEIIKDFTEELISRVAQYTPEQIEDQNSYIKVLLEAGGTILEILMKNEYLARIFFWEANGVDTEIDSLLNDSYKQLTAIVTGQIEKGQQIGVIRKQISAPVAGAAHVGMCTYIANRYLQNDFEGEDPLIIMNSIVQIHLSGLLTNPN